jgi:phosphoribosyl 1,2-cyclic phosphodiesterase
VRVFVLGSGSSGNAALVESGGTRVLVDAGFGPRAVARRMLELGAELLPRGIDAIVVSHQHGDHMGRLEPLARAFGCPVYLHRGIEARRVRRRFEVRDYEARAPFSVGSIVVDAIDVPHDLPQVALRLVGPDGAFGIATDIGEGTRELVRFFGQCDGALLEANHCTDLLWSGPYPQRLKTRVAGNRGHLSNAQAAHVASRLVGTRLRRLWLGHLSRANNTPQIALRSVRGAARGLDVAVVPHGVPTLLRVTPGGQLKLPF